MKTSFTERDSILMMLGSVILFAINTLLIRGVALHAPAADGWVASLFRGVIGLLVVGLVFSGRGFHPRRLFTRPLLLLRGVVGAFGILAFYMTVVHLGAGRAVIINLSYPIFGCLFAMVFLGERLSARAWIWLSAGFAGLVVFLGGGLQFSWNRYDLLAIAGAVAAGAVVTIIRELRHTEHASTIYASQCLGSIVLTAVPATAPAIDLPPFALGLMVLAAVLVSIAQLAMTEAYRQLSVARGSAVQMLLPLVTAVGGWIFFQESYRPIELAGAALTLIATWRVVAAPPAKPRLVNSSATP
ncbi:MAG: DMT family transporter [Akkermansiaceae bacterium]|jgi:drug/metabolite transporter (DMT)-like permease|nr:DMT family transporter [Akkermansiaceae bacterium]